MQAEKIIVDNSSDENLEHEEKNKQETEFTIKCNNLLDRINKNYREHRDEIKNLIKLHKKEIKLNKKTKPEKIKREMTGFTKPTIVPDKLVKLFKLRKGCVMSRVELTKLFYKMFKEKNLYYADDKRIFRANNDIKKALNLPDRVNDSIDAHDANGFNFYNIQTYLAECYNDFNKKGTADIKNIKVDN